jgi:hypothetical protein
MASLLSLQAFSIAAMSPAQPFNTLRWDTQDADVTNIKGD